MTVLVIFQILIFNEATGGDLLSFMQQLFIEHFLYASIFYWVLALHQREYSLGVGVRVVETDR